MNVKKILNAFGIMYEETHPAVSKKCVGIDCPYCHDTGKHMGIFLDTGKAFCWKCQKTRFISQVLYKLKGVTQEQFEAVSGIRVRNDDQPKNNLDRIFKKTNTNYVQVEADNSEIIKHFLSFESISSKPYLSAIHHVMLDYVTSRFTWDELKLYGAGYALSGPMMNRLVIPYPAPFIGPPIGFVGRDFTGIAQRKYFVTPGLSLHSHVYPNSAFGDRRTDVLVVVEGIFDSWAITDYLAVALCGKAISIKQISKVISMYPTMDMTLVICLDGDTSIRDRGNVQRELGVFFKNSVMVNLPELLDPSSIPTNELSYYIDKGVESHGKD